MKLTFRAALCGAGVVILACGVLPAQVNVTTQRYDGFRTASNLQETILNPSTVSASTFGQLWSDQVDGDVYAQPLYVQNVNLAGVGVRNVVYIATMHDVVYAFNADNPGPPLWVVDLRNATAGVTPYLSANFENPKWATPIGDAFGIQSTPVIDPNANLIYVVAQTSEPSGIVYRLHAFDIRSGAEPMPPTVIQATSAGITFQAQWQCQRPALALSGGQIYIGFGGRPDDDTPYYGWLMTYSAATLAQTGVFIINSTSYGGALWQGGGGPATDENGSVYAVSGNGFGSGDGVTNFAESLMKFSFSNGQLSLVDWFTPANSAYLDANDYDLSTNGPIVVPGAGLVATGGKSADFYMSSTSNLGKVTSTNSGAVQTFHIGVGTTTEYGQSNLTTGFALWPRGPNSILYAWPGRDSVYSYTLSGNQFLQSGNSTVQSVSAPGPSMVLTANGTQSGTGILWTQMSLVPQGYTVGYPGVLRAFNAENLTTELWNSNLNSARDGIAANAKYAVPTVVNGRAYVPTFSGVIQVYGLLSSQNFSLAAGPSALTVNQASSGTATITSSSLSGFTGTVAYTASGMPAGVTVSFSSASTTSSGQTVVTVSVAATVAGGATYPIVITGTSGTLSQTVTLELTIPVHSAPAVSISSPANNAAFTVGSSITITAQVSTTGATVAQVNFLQGTSVLGSVTTSPYTYTWTNLAAGTYQLTAKVTDSLGATTTSTPVAIVVSPPISVVVAPPAVTLTANQTQQFTTTVGNTTNSNVTWLTPSAGSINATGLYTAPPSISSQQTVTITAISAADSTKAATATITLMPPPDFALSETPMAMSVNQAASGTSTVTSSPVNGFAGVITYSASGVPSGVTVGFNPASTPGTGQTVVTVSVASSVVGGSTYPVVITGSSGTLSHSVTLPLSIPAHNAPSVSITAPTNNATFIAGANITINAQASATNATVSQVAFLQGTTTIGAVTAAPFTFTWTNAAAGAYQLTAKVTDSLGATTTSTPVAIVVSPPISVVVTPPAVTLTANQTQQFTATVSNSTNTSVTWSAPSAGTITPTGLYTAPASIAGQQTIAITATSAADSTKIASATVMLVPPPDFILSTTPSLVTVAPGGSATSQISVSMINGFTGSPVFAATGLPANLTASFSPASSSTGSTLTLTAASNATAGTYAITVTGTSGTLSHSVALSVTVPAPVSGNFTSVTLAPVANVGAIYTDGTPTNDGALDGLGDAYSANLLGSSLVAMGVGFTFGGPGTANAVTSTTIPLPPGNFASLKFLGTGENGVGYPIAQASRNRVNQTFVVTYTDGTTATFTQSLSDWSSPQNYAGETVVSTMPYTINPAGQDASGPWYLYGYSFPLNSAKVVKSITLPNNSGVAVVAMTLVPETSATSVSLTSVFNINGIFNDGSRPTNGGLDGDSYAYSSNLLGKSLTVSGATYSFGPANAADAVSSKVIGLPGGNFSSLKFLATGVNGNQANQNFVVTYTDGTTSMFTQSLTDWALAQSYAGQTVASTMNYRVTAQGGMQNGTFRLYSYSFPLNSAKTAKSITLPNNRNVVVLAITLQ